MKRRGMILLGAAIFVLTISHGATVLMLHRSVKLNERQLVAAKLDLCHLKHAAQIKRLTGAFLAGRMLFPDFRDAWHAENLAFLKACTGAA